MKVKMRGGKNGKKKDRPSEKKNDKRKSTARSET
jgi:hypothetical protein